MEGIYRGSGPQPWFVTRYKAMEENLKELRVYIEAQVYGLGEASRERLTYLSRLVFTRYIASVEQTDILSNCIRDNPAIPTKERIYAMGSEQLRMFTWTFQVHRLMCEIWSNQEDINLMKHLLVATCNMSGVTGRSMDVILHDWTQCFDGLNMDDESHRYVLWTRLNRQRNKIIGWYLDLPVEECFWNEFDLGIRGLTLHLQESQDWQAELERLLP